MQDLFLLFFVLVFAGMMLAAARDQKLIQAASSWPEVDAKVVDTITVAYDPASYDLVVSYSYEGNDYEARAENFYSIPTSDVWRGETVRIKVDPTTPQSCVVYQRIGRPVWMGPVRT